MYTNTHTHDHMHSLYPLTQPHHCIVGDWCPDCIRVVPDTLTMLASQKGFKNTIRVDVGTMEEWRSPHHPLRQYTSVIPSVVQIQQGSVLRVIGMSMCCWPVHVLLACPCVVGLSMCCWPCLWLFMACVHVCSSIIRIPQCILNVSNTYICCM